MLVMMAEEEEDSKRMIERLEGYLDEKKLAVNVSKTKIMRFRKGGGSISKREWRWKEKSN